MPLRVTTIFILVAGIISGIFSVHQPKNLIAPALNRQVQKLENFIVVVCFDKFIQHAQHMVGIHHSNPDKKVTVNELDTYVAAHRDTLGILGAKDLAGLRQFIQDAPSSDRCATRRGSVSERVKTGIAVVKKIAISPGNWRGETLRRDALLRLADLPGLSERDVDRLIAASNLVCRDSYEREILGRLVGLSHNIEQGVRAVSAMPISSGDWAGEADRASGLKWLIANRCMTPEEAELIASSARAIGSQSYTNKVLDALTAKLTA